MSAINRGAEYVTGRAEKFEARDGLPSKVGDSDQANDPLSIFGLTYQEKSLNRIKWKNNPKKPEHVNANYHS